MLTNFFGNSKPINFIIVSIFIITGILIKPIIETETLYNTPALTNYFAAILCVLFIIFLLNFIIRKNRLTKINTYSVLLFCCFIAMIPVVIGDWDILLSNLFLLLALRRIWSISSEKNLEKKILDASIWIAVASLFYFWCILFYAVLFIAILQESSKKLKLLWIPFIGFLTVITLITVYNLLVKGSFLWFLDVDTQLSFDYLVYKQAHLILPIFFLLIVLIWGLAQKMISASKGSLKDKSNFKILFVVTLIYTIIILLDPSKNGGELLFIMIPLAIITTNFIENYSVLWIKELFLWFVILLPIIINLL